MGPLSGIIHTVMIWILVFWGFMTQAYLLLYAVEQNNTFSFNIQNQFKLKIHNVFLN